LNRLLLALTAYVALGVLSWTTIADQRIRLGTLAILGMFAFKTYIRRKEAIHPEGETDAEK
jgi:PDZ domain-containing secreted protein